MLPRPQGGTHDELLLEALASGVAPELQAKVLLHALRQSDLVRIPDDPEAFARFALGALRDAVTARAGSAAADAVIIHLSPILQQASSNRRRRESHVTPQQGTRAIPAGDVDDEITPTRGSRQPHGRTGPTTVVVVSADRASAEDIGRRLGSLAKVTAVASIDELRAAIGKEEREQSTVVLVIDGRVPTLAPNALASIAPALSRGTSVLAWGLDAKYQEALAVVEAGGIRCVRCAAASRPVDISAVLRALV